MSKKMLIDATHPEETRVVVVDGAKVEDFDFESINKRQLSGNIYLAKVTRVEPSLQAAFVEYGGNRHGFLAFSEIHPDYYQIPVADREALLAAEEAEQAGEDEDAKPRPKPKARSRSRRKSPKDAEAQAAAGEPGAEAEAGAAASETELEPQTRIAEDPEAELSPRAEQPGSAETPDASPSGQDTSDAPAEERSRDDDEGRGGSSMAEGAGADAAEKVSEPFEEEPSGDAERSSGASKRGRRQGRSRRGRKGEESGTSGGNGVEDANGEDEASQIESVGAEEPREEVRPRAPRMRNYKIQEVIKVRQIMLVQVVKEERGNKGAALTTYLSLAGRYCVLMPNSARGGGVSRKITSAEDRKKLKEIASEFEPPKGMGLIIRTAGAKRTRTEIKRDYEFLLRQWEDIRELTLKSIAPTLIYEEGSLIKRSIRDIYSKDIEEILVEGEDAYREAKDYMRMLMPSHAKNVKLYKDPAPLFSRHQVESYLAAMFNPTVQLKSGGYIVIGVTEALVAIDVNSGRSTREGSIEETALKTNLEAADEVARQLRLRDLAGLIVIDFIDMDERRNNAAVEKRMKDRLSSDRARIQVGRISPFGLMEMSRQRLRPGMLEASTAPCPKCHGTGLTRSDDSLALSILREVEEEGVRGRAAELRVRAPVQIANFIINQKRAHLIAIEQRYGVSVQVEGDATLISPDFKLERLKQAAARPERGAPIRADGGLAAFDDPREEESVTEEAEPPAAPAERGARPDDRGSRDAEARGDNGSRSKRRRGKRGGRKRRRDDETENGQSERRVESGAETGLESERPGAPAGMEVYGEEQPAEEAPAAATGGETAAGAAAEEPPAKAGRTRARRSRRREQPQADVAEAPTAEHVEGGGPAAIASAAGERVSEEPAGGDAARPAPDTAAVGPVESAPAETAEDAAPVETPEPEPASAPAASEQAAAPESARREEPARPKRKGWWSLGAR